MRAPLHLSSMGVSAGDVIAFTDMGRPVWFGIPDRNTAEKAR